MTRAAIGQICSTGSITANLDQCARLVAKAAAGGAKILFLPEASDYIAPNAQTSLELAVSQSTSPFVRGLRAAAKTHQVAIHVGIHATTADEGLREGPDDADDADLDADDNAGLAAAGAPRNAAHRPQQQQQQQEQQQQQQRRRRQQQQQQDGTTGCIARGGGGGGGGSSSSSNSSSSSRGGSGRGHKILNRALYINAAGAIEHSATYDKLHVFDYGALRESATVQAGLSLTPPFDSPVGRIGSLICFDLRFPETAIALAQPGPSSAWRHRPAHILTYPSAFTMRTGEAAHWEVLLRARAIETQSWVVAAAQVGRHNENRVSYGQSMVVDPWGRVILQLRTNSTRESPSSGAETTDMNTDTGIEARSAMAKPESVSAADRAVASWEEIGFVDIDIDEVDRVRREMPLLRRSDVYAEL